MIILFQVVRQNLASYSIYHDTKTLLSKAHFNLRAWMTKSPQLKKTTQQEMTSNTDILSNVLGLLWNLIPNELSLIPKKPLVTNNPCTIKSELLQKLFNPIGLTTPVTIQAKVLIQKLCIKWDEPLGTQLARKWQEIAADLAQLHQISVKRQYLNNFNPADLHIHAFSDASIQAYGAAVNLSSHSDTTFVIQGVMIENPNFAVIRTVGSCNCCTASKVCDHLLEADQ